MNTLGASDKIYQCFLPGDLPIFASLNHLNIMYVIEKGQGLRALELGPSAGGTQEHCHGQDKIRVIERKLTCANQYLVRYAGVPLARGSCLNVNKVVYQWCTPLSPGALYIQSDTDLARIYAPSNFSNRLNRPRQICMNINSFQPQDLSKILI